MSETPVKMDNDIDTVITTYQSEETTAQSQPLSEPVFTLDHIQKSPPHTRVEISRSSTPPHLSPVESQITLSPPKIFQNETQIIQTPKNTINNEHHVHFSDSNGNHAQTIEEEIVTEQNGFEQPIETATYDDQIMTTPSTQKRSKREKPRDSTPSRRSLRLSMKSAVKTPQTKKISPKGR